MANASKRNSRRRRSKMKQLEELPNLASDERVEREPPDMQGQVYLKKRHARRFTRSHEWFALLHAGILRLYKDQKSAISVSVLAPVYKIDLSSLFAICVDPRQQRFVLDLPDESYYLWPVGKDRFEQWRDAIHKHRLYRQDLCRSGQDVHSDLALLSQPHLMQSMIESGQPETSCATCNSHDAEHMQTIDTLKRSVAEVKILHNTATSLMQIAAKHTADIQSVIVDIRALQSQLRVMVARIEAVVASLALAQRDDSVSDIDNSYIEDESSSEDITDPDGFTTPRENRSSLSVTLSMPAASMPSLTTLKGASSSTSSNEQRTREPIKTEEKRRSSPAKTSSTSRHRTSASTMNQNRRSSSLPGSPPKVSNTYPVDQPHLKRAKLPAVAPPGESISSKAIMEAIFKAGRGISLPISAYEPLGLLQVLCEELNYAKLLNRAAAAADPIARIADVAAFAVSAYACTVGRNRKPFNPMLCETYELEDVEEGWRFQAEQVSHHPSISACHAEGRGWLWTQTYGNKAKQLLLWGAVELQPEFFVHVRLTDCKPPEDYYWQKVSTVLHNVMNRPEDRFVSHQGEMRIRCSNGYQCLLTFFKSSRTAGRASEVKGEVQSPDGRIVERMEGTWDRGLFRVDGKGREPLSLFDKPPSDSHKYYGFSKYAIALNELSDGLRAALPPTDSRFRPDQRMLEHGQLEEAARTKEKLEKAQRAREEAIELQRPLWFDEKQNKALGCKLWVTNHKYWPARQKNFSGIQFPPLW